MNKDGAKSSINYMPFQQYNYANQIDIGNPNFWTGQWKKDPNEITGTQQLNVPIASDGTICPLEPLIPYQTHRAMLRHPTIAMARCLMIAPMTLVPWTLKVQNDAPVSARWLIQNEIVNRKVSILKYALEGLIDYGFQVNEVVYNPDGKNEVGEDAITIYKIKPLLPYITFLRANPLNGEFAGIRQNDVYTGALRYVEPDRVQLFNIDVEGTNLYGNSVLDNSVKPWDNWNTVNDVSMGYLNKIAGAHWVIYYPVGMTEFNGVDTDNGEIAKNLLTRLEANGGLTIPNDIRDFTMEANQNSSEPLWKIENISDSGATSASYVENLRHYEELMVMGLMFPPHALLEGQFGTKAEAVVHAEAPVAAMEMRVRGVVDQLNNQTVDTLLELNYGKMARGCVQIEIPPITHDDSEFLKQIYQNLLSNPDSGYALLQNINLKGLGDKLQLNNL